MVKESACRTRPTHSPAFKARVALAAVREDISMAEVCKDFELHASQVIESKRQLLEGAADVFGGDSQAMGLVDLALLHAMGLYKAGRAHWSINDAMLGALHRQLPAQALAA